MECETRFTVLPGAAIAWVIRVALDPETSLHLSRRVEWIEVTMVGEGLVELF